MIDAEQLCPPFYFQRAPAWFRAITARMLWPGQLSTML